MRTIIIITLLALSLVNYEPKSEPEVINITNIDPDLFKRELQGAVMEFYEDAGIDPDTAYMPFKDEL